MLRDIFTNPRPGDPEIAFGYAVCRAMIVAASVFAAIAFASLAWVLVWHLATAYCS